MGDPGARGRLVIADKAVERIASGAAREVPAVHPTGARLGLPPRTSSLPSASATVAGGRSRVKVEVAIRWPASAATAAAAVRDHVQERVATLTGMTVDGVDVVVADVVHAASETRRVQ